MLLVYSITVISTLPRDLSPVPHTDQNISVPEDEEENVVLGHIVEVGVFLIGEEEVRFPQTLEHLRVHSQRVTFKVGGKSKARVVPPLTKEYVYSVVL